MGTGLGLPPVLEMHESELPYSQASENNKLAILEILKRHVGDSESLLEVGSGTGQHAVFFAQQFPQLRWQPSNTADSVELLNLRIDHFELPNVRQGIALDVNDLPWPVDHFDIVFSANTLHIMSEASVENFFAGLSNHLNEGARLLVYGPFKYRGEFTTDSNANFDLWLKDRDPLSGIRDFEWVSELASSIGLSLIEDNAMPANNQLLVWRAD